VSRRRSRLSKPLEWYGVTFLRLTHAISRRQEFIADVVAVRVAGARALGGALRALERADMGFGAYWQQELAPALDRGFRPPMPVGWLEAAGASAPGLDGLTPAQLPAIAERLRADPQALARQLGIAAERASATLEAAIAFALVERMRVGEHGMTLTAAPGEPVVF